MANTRRKRNIPNTIPELLALDDIKDLIDDFINARMAGCRGALLIYVDSEECMNVRYAGLTFDEAICYLRLAEHTLIRNEELS